MSANEQTDGILLDLIRYVINITTVIGSLALVGVLLFIMVARANPESVAVGGEAAAPATVTAAPAGEEPTEVPTPDPEVLAQGEEIFTNQGCGACHTLEGVANGQVGPNLTNVGAIAGERAQAAGLADAEAYIRESIVQPSAFIAPDCPTGPCADPSAMPANFGAALSDEELDTLVQYLLAQTGG